MSWPSVIGYLGAAALCYLAGRRRQKSRRIWWAIAAILVFFAVNKHVDLLSWVAETGRTIAQGNNWYQQRQMVQRDLIAAMMGVGLIGIILLAWFLRKQTLAVRTAAVMTSLLLVFVGVRALSLHQVDVMLARRVLGLSVNAIVELSSILVIAVIAARAEIGSKH